MTHLQEQQDQNIGEPIDLTRPKLFNPDGSFSTEETITISDADGTAFNIPTIVNGKRVSDEEAERLFRSGKNPDVGTFPSVDEAVKAARARTNRIGTVRGLDGQDKQFDLAAAKEAGHTDQSIADFLSKQANFDIAKARESGHDDANIINFLTTGKSFRDITQAEALGQGFETGLIDVISGVAGAPVDLLAAARTAITGEPLDPFGGSRSIRRGFETIGVGPEVAREELRPEVRPAFAGGEIAGGAAPFIAAPFTLPARLGGVLKPVANLVQTAPGRFLAAEVASTTGAALGAAGAEAFDPGDPLTAFLATVGGGFVNPTALLAKTGGKTVENVKTLVKSFSESGRKDKAAQIVQDIVSESGEDIDDITRLLDKADIQGVKLTSGQKTGSPALLAIESKLAAGSSRFAGEAEELATNSLKTLRELTDNLTKTGDPAALRTAAKLRSRFFDDLLSRRIEDAGQDALEARAKLTGTRADIASISADAKGSLENALKDARRIEDEIWKKVPKNTRIGTEGLLDATAESTERFLLESENLPTFVQNEITKQVDRGATVADAVKFRSRLLALGREAKANNKATDAAVFNSIADGIRRDLDALPDGVADEARSFSRALHDKFTSTFAGEALGVRGTGAERIPAELMLERAFGGGGTRGELRLGELSSAAAFPEQVFGKPMLDAQEQFLSIAAQNSIDDAGRVNPARLQKFINDNQDTLNRFPDLRNKLSDAATAERTFRGVETASKQSTNIINKRTAFANLIKTDDPVVAVGNVLTGQNTRRNYTQLARLAKKSGQGSVDGLRSSTLKNAFDKATNSSGEFSFKRFDQILKNGLSREDQGLMSLMKQNGIIDKAGADRLNSLVKRSIQIEDALGNQKKLDKLIENPDGLFDLVTRIVGAKLGAAGVAGGDAGSSLIAASAGSRFARNFAEKIPATKVSEVLELAANDPKFMSTLLKKAKTIKQKAELERQINAFLISAGFQFETEQE